jgi:diguanylate cyclase (GGDEF)-like protein/PAS domain S-box-containing protein
MRISSIQTHVLLLVLAVSIPLAAFVGFGIYSDMQQTISHTKASLRVMTSTMVRNTGRTIDEAHQVLERLAVRPLVRRMDPKHCDPILNDLKYVNPGYANLGYLNLDGLVICSAVPQPGGKPVYVGDAPWFQNFMKERSFTIGEPFFGPITHKWVSVLSLPIWNERHEMLGAIVIPLDLKAFDPDIPTKTLPEGTRFGFIREDGILVWRNTDPDELIGTRLKAEGAKLAIEVRDGEFESTGTDGVLRYYAVLPIPETNWIAFMGVPASTVYAEGKQRAIGATAIALGAIVLLYLAAIAIARRITRPVAELDRVTRRLQEGDYDVRATVSGPREIAAVAQEFNTMIDTQRHSVEQLRIAAAAFESQESLMITDADGVILRVNRAFTETTGYPAEEVVGQTPRLLKSGRHDAEFYRTMWESLLRTGTWQGEIWDRRKNGQIYPKWLTISAVKGDDGVITHYVGSHFDITERKASEEKIQHLAFYDHLTDLPNRRLLLDRLNQALAFSARSRRAGALLFIDLDNFKNLNDTLGHDMGDMLLQQVTQRLESCIRRGDTVARLGGDEFVVMLLDLSEQPIEAAAQTEVIGEKILNALGLPYPLATQAYHCTASIGVTLFDSNLQSTDELMKQADIAMYQAKKAGRNALRFFDRQMQENISARVSLENELHDALEFRQLHLHYQIQVDNAYKPLGAEALIRWIHPRRGIVLPAQFVPLAEESGLILPIGLWVLDAACGQIKAWEKDVITRDLTLAVNVSAKQFRQVDFVTQVQSAIQRHSIRAALLKLELTESLLQEDIDVTIATMNALNEIGVQFSLDDFGTGYSSLQYLKRLPLHQIKIDQSFVRDIERDGSDIAVVRATIAMARSLELDVIAEGVETEEQRQVLLRNGCSSYQGYLFGRPVPIEEFEALLKAGRPRQS